MAQPLRREKVFVRVEASGKVVDTEGRDIWWVTGRSDKEGNVSGILTHTLSKELQKLVLWKKSETGKRSYIDQNGQEVRLCTMIGPRDAFFQQVKVDPLLRVGLPNSGVSFYDLKEGYKPVTVAEHEAANAVPQHLATILSDQASKAQKRAAFGSLCDYYKRVHRRYEAVTCYKLSRKLESQKDMAVTYSWLSTGTVDQHLMDEVMREMATKDEIIKSMSERGADMATVYENAANFYESEGNLEMRRLCEVSTDWGRQCVVRQLVIDGASESVMQTVSAEFRAKDIEKSMYIYREKEYMKLVDGLMVKLRMADVECDKEEAKAQQLKSMFKPDHRQVELYPCWCKGCNAKGHPFECGEFVPMAATAVGVDGSGFDDIDWRGIFDDDTGLILQ